MEVKDNSAQLQSNPATLRDPLGVINATIHFLFIPAPFMDNGSFFLNLQSYESFAWYMLYLIFVVLVWRTLRGVYQPNLTLLSSTLFNLGFVLQSALVEINDGTSVRHRAVLLIAVLIMIASARKTTSSSNQGLNPPSNP